MTIDLKRLLVDPEFRNTPTMQSVLANLGEQGAAKMLDVASNPSVFKCWTDVVRISQQLVAQLQREGKPVAGNFPLRTEMGIGLALCPALRLCSDELLLVYALQTCGVVYDRLTGIEHTAQRTADRYSLVAHYLALARWALYNFPVVRLSPVQACALALSDLDDEALTQVRAPWPSFRVLVGDAFVTDTDRVQDILVSRWASSGYPDRHDKWHLETRLVEGETLWALEQDTSTLYGGDLPEVKDWAGSGSTMDKSEKRVLALTGRTALNLCEALANGTGVLQRASERKCKGGKKRPILGKGLLYDVRLPIVVDMREHVRDYLSMDVKRVYKVRWVVRGHWRLQACGVGRLMRRRRWIGPFWKGPEKGTKIVREHQLTDQVVGLPDE